VCYEIKPLFSKQTGTLKKKPEKKKKESEALPAPQKEPL
jgi:hypothetical protein